jgi:hypothetical protein
MMAALAAVALLASPSEAPDWFRVFQYAASPSSLRGCSECQGEPDDVCEVRAGAQSRPLAEYDQKRWPGADRVRLLRSKADPDCAIPTAAFYGPRTRVELAAIRVSRAPPGPAVLDRMGAKFAIAGWPRAPQRRKGQQLAAAAVERDTLRMSLVCWSSERGWPSKALDAAAPCEWWLLPFRGDGEPDLSAHAFPLMAGRDRWPESVHSSDARWTRAFDRTVALDDAVLLNEPPAAATPPAPLAPSNPAPPPAPTGIAARCGDEARTRSGLLDRFDQWETQIVGARTSLDRSRWALDLAAWSGHCQELEVLRAALEQQLGCSVPQEGRCVAAAGETER